MVNRTTTGLLVILAMSLIAGVCHAQTTQPSETKTEFKAEVYGKELTAAEPRRLVNKILGELNKHLIRESNIQVAESEIDLYIPRLVQDRISYIANQKKYIADYQAKLALPDASKQQRDGARQMIGIFEGFLHADKYWIYLQAMADAKSETEKQELTRQNTLRMRERAHFFIRVSKTNRVLFKKYGGRVALMGGESPVPYEAQRGWLDEQLASGACKIFDVQVVELFKKVSASEQIVKKSVSEEEGRELMAQKRWWEETPAGE